MTVTVTATGSLSFPGGGCPGGATVGLGIDNPGSDSGKKKNGPPTIIMEPVQSALVVH